MTPEDALIRLVRGDAGGGPTDLMRLCLFDWAVCAIAGRAEAVARKVAGSGAHGGPATLIGGGTAAPGQAALLNGTAGHALDYDDTHFDHIGHTSAVVMPAMLALAEGTGITNMARILDAALIGSEAAVRVGVWLGRDHYQIGFHQTATSGAIGAAAGGARLLRLDAQTTGHALGLAATAASGLKGQFGTMGKPLNAGLAARAGVEAALWAQAGVTSDPNGVTQFGATHHGQADPSAWNPDPTWRIARISHKFHACCHGLHATLEALRDAPKDVEAMTIHTHPRWMTVCNDPTPTTGLACKFSYRMVAAMALAGRDTADIAQFSDAAARVADLRATMERVTVIADDTLTEMQARLEGQAGGAPFALFHDLDAPMELAARQDRLLQKARTVVGPALAEDLWHAVQGEDPGPFMGLLGRS